MHGSPLPQVIAAAVSWGSAMCSVSHRSNAPSDPVGSTGGDPFDGVVLRPLRERPELEACLELQKQVWGEDFEDLTPPALLKIADEVGGVSAGAFSVEGETERLDGFVFGISGPRDGELVHWSHMMAVRPERRGLGLGVRLKAFQRELLLERGIRTAFWTYDPLVARNAHVNIMRLGARPVIYRRNYYGSGDDSALSAGIGTDRFVVRWDLTDERVVRALAEEPPEPSAEQRRAPVLGLCGSASREQAGSGSDREPDPDPDPDPHPDTTVLERAELPAVRVEIPVDVQKLRDDDPERARAWRDASRHTIETALAHGYRVEAFLQSSDRRCRDRCFYLLARSGP